MLASSAAEYGGEMLYRSTRARATPFWAMEYSRDEGLRKYWDEFTPPFHQDGDGPLVSQRTRARLQPQPGLARDRECRRWFDYWHERPGTGTRVSSGGVNIIFRTRIRIFRGAENYRRSGEVTRCGYPRTVSGAHQVMWDGWVDIERPRIHIIGHWNYAPETKKNVYVVSSAERVELFLNDKSLGNGTQSNRFCSRSQM